MALAATALAYQSGSYGGPAPHGLDRQYASYRNENPSMPEDIEGNDMDNARGNLARTFRGTNTPNSSAEDADIIFISERARQLSAKEGAALTGMTPKGFQKLQLGDNAISYKKLTRWLKADQEFAAAYAAHVGLILPGQAESAAALTKAVNAYVRGSK